MKASPSNAIRAYLSLDDESLVRQCEVDTYRASGPGGQKRNKTSSAVRLRHTPTGLAASAKEDRSQHVNKRRALRRLRRELALAERASIDLDAYQPSDLLSECIDAQRHLHLNRRDARYWLVVAEILDVIVACDVRMRTAAAHLGVTTSGLVAFLRRDVTTWRCLSLLRASTGLKPLR